MVICPGAAAAVPAVRPTVRTGVLDSTAVTATTRRKRRGAFLAHLRRVPALAPSVETCRAALRRTVAVPIATSQLTAGPQQVGTVEAGQYMRGQWWATRAPANCRHVVLGA
jgi:hypothetical protein